MLEVMLRGTAKASSKVVAKVATVAIGSFVASKINKAIDNATNKHSDLRAASIEGLLGGAALLANNGLDAVIKKY